MRHVSCVKIGGEMDKKLTTSIRLKIGKIGKSKFLQIFEGVQTSIHTFVSTISPLILKVLLPIMQHFC